MLLDSSNTSIPVCYSIDVIVNKLILQWSINVNVGMYHAKNNCIMNEIYLCVLTFAFQIQK